MVWPDNLQKIRRGVQSPVATRLKKWKKLVVANIEILQYVARGGPRGSLSLPEKEAREPKTYIL